MPSTTQVKTVSTEAANGSLKLKQASAYTTTPQINGERLMEALHATCEFGKAHKYGEHYTETGMARLSLNDDDKTVREWLLEQVYALGCSVKIDQMGNMFAVLPGKNNDVPPVYMGSHLDTQMTGGRYDGILGVQAALEGLRTIKDSGYQTQGPVGLVNWTNEEGARFPMVTVSSGVWAGGVPLETAWACREITAPAVPGQPQSMKEELARIGFLGETPASYEHNPMAAHFELHIEQGPILENEARKIGVVVGAQGYSWYEVEVVGKDCHAGTTPLNARRDALLAAAKMIVAGNTVAHDCQGVITTGVIKTEPSTVNTIVRKATFTLDIRHPSAATLAKMVADCQTAFAKIAAEDSEKGVETRWTCLTENEPVTFHPDCVSAIEQAAEEWVGEGSAVKAATEGDQKLHMPIWSGAGHDSCNASKRCPAGMVFTPTRDGMSHTPTEYCKPEDCVLGAQVLLGAALRFDAARGL